MTVVTEFFNDIERITVKTITVVMKFFNDIKTITVVMEIFYSIKTITVVMEIFMVSKQ